LGIGEHDTVGGLLDDAREQYEALERLASLSEIVEHQHSSRNNSAWIFEGPRVHTNPDAGMVLRAAHENKLIDDFLTANGEDQRQLTRGHD
jgi:hypothetical protein